MALETWLLFCTVGLAAALSPGPAILLAITNGVAGGGRRVVWSSLGNIVGLLLISCVSIFGLGALLKASAAAFTVTKVVGAAYLVWLGIKQWRRPATGLSDASPAIASGTRDAVYLAREGALVALTNPKAIVFFTALFPVFLDARQALAPQFAIMTATMMALSFICLMGYGLMARRVRHWLATPRHHRMFQRVTGSVFIVMGGSLLTLTRSR